MLRKRHLSLLLDQLFGLKPVVEVKLDLPQSLEHSFLVIDGFLAELLLNAFLLIKLSLGNGHITVD